MFPTIRIVYFQKEAIGAGVRIMRETPTVGEESGEGMQRLGAVTRGLVEREKLREKF